MRTILLDSKTMTITVDDVPTDLETVKDIVATEGYRCNIQFERYAQLGFDNELFAVSRSIV